MKKEKNKGYSDLTNREIKWINEIQARTRLDLEERGVKADVESILATAIYGVTFFTRKLKSVRC